MDAPLRAEIAAEAIRISPVLMRLTANLLAEAALAWPASAVADDVTMTGRFPAPHREASRLGSLSVEGFAGRLGPQLEAAMVKALSKPEDDGKVHFALVARSHHSRDIPDGELSGVVTTDVEENGYIDEQKRCVERDKDGDCTRKESVRINCTRRVADVYAVVRIEPTVGGPAVYSEHKQEREEIRWCADQTPSATGFEMVQRMISDIAKQVRKDLTPSISTYRVRFLESTAGMPKDLAMRFRASIKPA